MRRKPWTHTVMAVTALACAAAMAAEPPQHVGDWEIKSPQVTINMSLRADGVLTLQTQEGTYRVDGDKISATLGGATNVYDLKLEGNTLTLSGGDIQAGQALTFTRKGAQTEAAPPKKLDGPYIGEWEVQAGSATLHLSLRPDGTMQLEDSQGTYDVEGDKLITTGTDGRREASKFEVQGDALTITSADGAKFLKFVRKGQAPVDVVRTTEKPSGKMPPFTVYKAQDHQFGYPEGWTVQAIQNGYVMVEKDLNGPTLLLVGGPAQPGVETLDQAATKITEGLKQSIPTLAAVNQKPYYKNEKVLETWLRFTQGTVEYDALCFTMLEKGNVLFVLFYAPRARTDEFNREQMLEGVIRGFQGQDPNPPAEAAAQPAQQPAAAGEADMDEWFRPAGKALRGFYGGAIVREELGSHATIGVNTPGTLNYQRADRITTGGDFRIAFYEDGSVRAQLLVLNYTPMLSYDVPFLYEGKFQLAENGQFSTSEMPLANKPSTFLKFEDKMTGLRLKGQYDKAADAFKVLVETFNPKENVWSKWGDGDKVLSRATARTSTMYGTVRNPGGTTSFSGQK